MKRVLIINGHPREGSYCHALCKAYSSGASRAGNEVVLLNLFDLKFDPNFLGTYSKEAKAQLEPDLRLGQEKIKWADHIVVVHPVWWGSVPAQLKGFFDKTLVPGFAFRYKQQGPWWDKLLSGKTGEIIYTADTPPWFNTWIYRAPAVNMVKRRVMAFCGISTRRVTGFGPMRSATQQQREKWLEKTEKLGTSA